MDREWAGLSPEAKVEKIFKSWLAPQGIDFISSEAEKAYRERAARIKDAIQLKVPDRVPVIPSVGFFPALLCRDNNSGSHVRLRQGLPGMDKIYP